MPAAVARHAGLAPGLIHYHFEDKLEILVAAVRALAARHARAMDVAIGRSPDAPSRLVAFVDVHLGLGAHADPEALACWVLVVAEALREPRVRAEVELVLADLAKRLTGIIEQGNASRTFACPDPEAASTALLATVQGYFTVATTARGLIPPGSAARCALRMAEGLLRPKRPLARRR